MGGKKSIKPITYMKTHAADILATVSETRDSIIITHNGEGKMVFRTSKAIRRPLMLSPC